MNNFYTNLPVLITGGAGFIGSHLAEKLVELNAKVTVLDNISSGNLENLNHIKSKINLINGDITDFNKLLYVTKNQSIIFHLAAFISPVESMENPQKCNLVNVLGTMNLLEAARINKVDRFIFSSSSAVYGKSENICMEDQNCDPISIYGFTKLIGEQYCKKYSEFFGLKTICLRYFNVYGNRQNPTGQYASVVAKFKNCMKNNQPIIIFGDGSQTRDFIDVDQIVDANINLAMINITELNGQSVNVATGKSMNLIELINQLKSEFPQYNQEIVFLPARHGDIPNSKADCLKLGRLSKQIYFENCDQPELDNLNNDDQF